MPLSPAHTAIIKATVPILEKGGEALTTHFYKLMLSTHPEVRALFNPAHQASGAQPRALANAVLQYARCIEHLDRLPPELVPQIVAKHVALNVQPSQYSIVGSCLLQSIRDVLGPETATDDVIAAWAAAYGQLADILIGLEEGVYKATESAVGGWRGTRAFRIARKERESDVITSFYLAPEDGKPLVVASAGQFIGMQLHLPVVGAGDKDGGAVEEVRRNYSLSAATLDGSAEYRISVKREAKGRVSRWLHDEAKNGTQLMLYPPAGSFIMSGSAGQDRPTLLISAGVGITPILAMLQHRAALKASGPCHFVHAARDGSVHAFRKEVDELAARAGARSFYCYSKPRSGVDIVGRDYDAAGRLDAARLREWMPSGASPADVDAYFVGPREFMRDVQKALLEIGVPPAQARFEFFGPAGALE